MPPTLKSSVKCMYIMNVALTLMGMGFMLNGDLEASWMVNMYNLNLRVFETWRDQGLLDQADLEQYKRLGLALITFGRCQPCYFR